MRTLAVIAVSLGLLIAGASHATGLATCNSGPQSGWQPQATLEKILSEQGWKIRRVKIDGGCYEVYALNDKGDRVEAYFHPVTLKPVPTSRDRK